MLNKNLSSLNIIFIVSINQPVSVRCGSHAYHGG